MKPEDEDIYTQTKNILITWVGPNLDPLRKALSSQHRVHLYQLTKKIVQVLKEKRETHTQRERERQRDKETAMKILWLPRSIAITFALSQFLSLFFLSPTAAR